MPHPLLPFPDVTGKKEETRFKGGVRRGGVGLGSSRGSPWPGRGPLPGAGAPGAAGRTGSWGNNSSSSSGSTGSWDEGLLPAEKTDSG